ncbi:MAG: hypothetical protein B6229_09590 [Spirochaetaceae bacterium 4572_7]|nr:MAG: hypothetical protein B6229_09590 [Spirochaetaceae bacterium 4572_7]
MDNDYQGLINIERLNLIERTLTDRDKIKLKKKLDRLFNKSSSETKSLLNLFSIFDKKANTTPKNNYTIGDRVLVVVKNQVLLNKAIKDIKKSSKNLHLNVARSKNRYP